MKEFHIISTGNSLITNAQKAGTCDPSRKIAEEQYWKALLDNPGELEKLYGFLKSDPKKISAELNTFLRVVNTKNSEVEVYLFGTKTSSNELARRIIERFLKEEGFKIYTPYEVSGYFWEKTRFDEKYARDEFQKGISELLDRLIYLAKKKKEEGFKVYFNPTGGLKAHVMACALAGFLTNTEVYYMNEEFANVVFLPPLLYLPKGKELEVLEIIFDKSQLSGASFEELKESYAEEISRLEIYGLIDVERDEIKREVKVRITNKGILLFRELKGDNK
jgi:putative CRISPR-associated protein (TIGR02619 family)